MSENLKISSVVKKWLSELQQARRREKDFRKDGKWVQDLYEGKRRKEFQYNVLFSNTETLSPALYNSLPRPVVKRRHNADDPIGRQASQLLQRALTFLLDTDMRDYSPFDSLMETAVQSALVPGRGITRFRYDADIQESEEEAPKVSNELICGENVPWDRFLFGYATDWKNVPWIAFELPMTKEELEKTFGEGVTANFELVNIEQTVGEDSHRDEGSSTDGAWVYEIWDRTERKVIFISENYKMGVLKEVEDPLGLSGFFPCPEPLIFINPINSLIPIPLYTMYKEQAEELNRITVRINRIIAALKVRGLYDSTVEGMAKLLEADDNTLVPVENVAALQQGATLEKALFFLPIEKLVAVLQQLYAQRMEIKQVIFEITGLADIMRGSSQASETLGAQQLKNQWGTLRLKRGQKKVQQYVRNCLRIMAELTATKLSPATIRQITESQLPELSQKTALQEQLPSLELSGQPIPPEVSAILNTPALEEVLVLLQDDLQRAYHIDIETNSTIDAEATEDKQDLAELMNSIAQFLNGVAPAVEQGVLPFEAAKAVLLGVVRRYRFGDEVEDAIKSMQPPQTKGPDPKMAEQQQKELQKAQAEIEKQSKDLETQRAAAEMELQAQRQEFELEKAFARRELALEKQFALKELSMQATFVEQAQALKEQTAKETATGREASLGQREKTLSDRENVISLASALKEGITQSVEGVKEVLTEQLSQPKRARRTADGSWETF